MKRALITLLLTLSLAAPSARRTEAYQSPSSKLGKLGNPGKRGRALLVGINQYKNFPDRPTPGAEEDALETREFIKRQYGFEDGEIEMLLGPKATARNIVETFRDWLVKGTQPGDRVFFLYSGHGTRVKDDNEPKDEKDGEDEALAPYDVDRGGANLIRDDVFNQLLAELSGRMVVMVFDSCHSGTISRGGISTARPPATGPTPKYLPSPEEFAQLEKSGGTRSVGGGMRNYVVEPLKGADVKSRDLLLVVDAPRIKNTGIVIFSAAQSGQRAFPLEISPGKFRGALSYAFNEAQSDGAPVLRELNRRIAARIATLQTSGKLNKEQQPAFEVFSGTGAVPLLDQPLFGAAQMAQVLAEGNPGSKIRLELAVEPNQRVFSIRKQDPISYRVKTYNEGYLYLLVFSEENKATCLFPNPALKGGQNNRVTAGTRLVPPDGNSPYKAQAPIGRDVVIALLSTSRINLGEKENYTWDEIFERLRDQKFFEYVKSRGIGTGGAALLAQTDWQAVSLVLETIE